jgi:hypothetical protein
MNHEKHEPHEKGKPSGKGFSHPASPFVYFVPFVVEKIFHLRFPKSLIHPRIMNHEKHEPHEKGKAIEGLLSEIPASPFVYFVPFVVEKSSTSGFRNPSSTRAFMNHEKHEPHEKGKAAEGSGSEIPASPFVYFVPFVVEKSSLRFPKSLIHPRIMNHEKHEPHEKGKAIEGLRSEILPPLSWLKQVLSLVRLYDQSSPCENVIL